MCEFDNLVWLWPCWFWLCPWSLYFKSQFSSVRFCVLRFEVLTLIFSGLFRLILALILIFFHSCFFYVSEAGSAGVWTDGDTEDFVVGHNNGHLKHLSAYGRVWVRIWLLIFTFFTLTLVLSFDFYFWILCMNFTFCLALALTLAFTLEFAFQLWGLSSWFYRLSFEVYF